jgi:3D (Asp-Asp-Asp) domain-containing protein
MKRRLLFLAMGAAVLLGLLRGHFIVPPLRRPDAVVTVRTTGYCACPRCSGWRFNWLGFPVAADGKIWRIGQTASGRRARPGSVAADPRRFPPGTRFYIPGYGWGRAEDAGALRGDHLDLYFLLHRSAVQWGVQSRTVQVWYPRRRSP